MNSSDNSRFRYTYHKKERRFRIIEIVGESVIKNKEILYLDLAYCIIKYEILLLASFVNKTKDRVIIE